MDQKQSLNKDIIEAWSRFVNMDYTIEDVSLIIDSVKSDDHFQEFKEVSDQVWNETLANGPTLTNEKKEAYRKEIAQMISDYERKQTTLSIQGQAPLSTPASVQATVPAAIPMKTSGKYRRRLFYVAVAAAAAVLLGIIIPATILFQKPETENFIVTVTQRGEIKSLTLPDQSKVTLNAGSMIKYPDKFTGNERIVELSGEALFEVTANQSQPFLVNTENVNIRVLGTVFNVNVYAGDASSAVSVVSGKVEVDVANSMISLEKGQQVKMDNVTHNFEKLTIDTDKYLSWIDGKLSFDRTSIKDVVNILNRSYPQAEIKLAEGDYSNCLFSGVHDNKSLEAVLTSIVYSTGLKCKKQGNKYTIYLK